MIHDVARTTSPGAGLPDFVRIRMEDLGIRPSLRQLAALSGVNQMTLQGNLSGIAEMKLTTAKRVSKALQMSLDEFADQLQA